MQKGFGKRNTKRDKTGTANRPADAQDMIKGAQYANVTNEKKPTTEDETSEVICFYCKEKGHYTTIAHKC